MTEVSRSSADMASALEPRAFIDARLADLAEANALYGKDQRLGAPDKIARNDREISWLKDLRSVIASRTGAPAQASPMRDALERCAGALAAAANERGTIRFTGKWSKLGSAAVGSILDEADAALAASPAPSSWQPIETAPRDYTPILAIENFTRVDDNQLPYPPDQMVVQWSEKANGWASFGIIIDSFEPTHWMPLPTPPSSVTSTNRGGSDV